MQMEHFWIGDAWDSESPTVPWSYPVICFSATTLWIGQGVEVGLQVWSGLSGNVKQLLDKAYPLSFLGF